MATHSAETAGLPSAGARLLACVADHGSAAHPYPTSDALLRGPHCARNLADAIHFLCILHGRHPGVVDHAANRCLDAPARGWFATATAAFAQERAFLARLAGAAGPLPSTMGACDTESAVRGQRHAIEMLALSERSGCALGAALAIAIDWGVIHAVLAAAGQRFGVEFPLYRGDPEAVRALADGDAGVERALLFGAEQIVIQHFGLWDLLEARQQARGD